MFDAKWCVIHKCPPKFEKTQCSNKSDIENLTCKLHHSFIFLLYHSFLVNILAQTAQ